MYIVREADCGRDEDNTMFKGYLNMLMRREATKAAKSVTRKLPLLDSMLHVNHISTTKENDVLEFNSVVNTITDNSITVTIKVSKHIPGSTLADVPETVCSGIFPFIVKLLDIM